MGKGNFPLYAFNRGEVSRFALGRVDLDRMRLSAEEQVNFQPMVLGPMTLRPGLKYLGSIGAKPNFIPFVFGNDDAAAIELTSPTVTISIASPAVVIDPSHGFADGQAVVLQTTGQLPVGLTAGQTYYVRNTTADTYRLAASPGGAAIATSGTQSGTHMRPCLRVWVPSDSAATSNAHAAAVNGVAEAAADNLIASREDGELEALTRPTVGTTVTHGDFSSAAGWTLSPQINAKNTAAIAEGKLTLNAQGRGGVGYAFSAVTIPPGSRNREHAFRIVVERGTVTFKCGTSSVPLGNSATTDNIIATTELGEGVHSLAFTPKANQSSVYVCLETRDTIERIVDSVTIETSGNLVLPAPWDADDLDYVRHAQSGDVVFVACKGVHPYKIERRGARSWSVVKYQPRNGPLKAVATVEGVKLAPGEMYGNTTLTSNRPFFTGNHVGCIFRLFQSGQTRKVVLSGDDEYTDVVRLVGVGEGAYNFSILVKGTFKGVLQVQVSFETNGDQGVGFRNVSKTRIVGDGVVNTKLELNPNDKGNFNNVILFYRVRFKPYTSGAATIEFRDRGGVEELENGGGAGLCRVTGFTNTKQVSIEVLEPFTSLAETRDWQESDWSGENGTLPSSVAFHDGRLWWAGGDKVWASVSDDYTNFDIEKEGDAAPILRSVGYGPIDTISWMLPLTRLILGREGAETSVRSSSLDEPITAATFTLKDCSTKGSARVAAVKCDTRGVFVAKSGNKVYELALDMQAADYRAHDLTRLHPEIAGGGFNRLCIQHNPDTAIHFVRADGQAAVLLYDKEDEVEAWWRVQTDGVIEDAFVLPGVGEDNVYYVVKRIIDNEEKRYLEKFARRSQCSGLPEARLVDSHVFDGDGDRTIRGLAHLEGKAVVAWGWNDNADAGVDLGSFAVANGQIKLPVAYNNVCVGLPYDASFTSAKLAYAADQGTAVNQKKRLIKLGLILFDTHYQGLKYGQGPGGKATVTMSAATDLVTDTAHGLVPGQPVVFTTSGELLTGLVEDAVYYIAHPVGTDSYKLATSIDAAIDQNGARVALSGTQSGVHTRTAFGLDDLPLVSEGEATAANTVHAEFDQPMVEVPGEWHTDARLHLKASSPRPCTVAAAVIGLQTHG